MKTTDFKRLVGMLTLLVLTIASAQAQQKVKIADKELQGAWMLEWMQYDGEKKMICGKTMGYTSFKYYGVDGEYACCEIVMNKEGKIFLNPHEYGTYTYKNGIYSEMGRPAVKPNEMMLEDATHFKGRWKNRTEAWVKVALPEKVVKHIVNCCKFKEPPADIQQLIGKHMFK